MATKYEKGQKVAVTLVKPEHFTSRDADIEKYSGQSGKITDHYWITLSRGKIVHIYTVQVKDKEIVLHEDEIEPYIE